MVAALTAEELAAYFALRRAGDLLQRAVTGHLRPYGLTEVQFTVLAQLRSEAGGIGMGELAKALVVSKGGLTYQAKQLEARGLVARVADPNDDRAVRMTLTEEGRALLDKVLPEHIAQVRELFFDRIDAADLHTVRTALERIG
ncbi:HTH-type transcriptional regulator MhqR [Arthrobacter saudimassiliensis]|uniref:HTH-type transcriptional regulator MhqR n=1 Tax=Arthrobacter saudimassiliensis TaxID=1461584 RepID=A0A078MLY7_9MICC|nr:HTH-type transcriptional regulator MhqR [Arthrobacter saudimassiliensis]